MQATTDPVPRLSVINLLLQPIRVIPKPILFIPSIRNNFTSALVGNDESENGEGEEKNDEDKHDEEVEPEEPRHAAARADEAGEWDEHEEDAERDDGLLQPPLALGGALLAQPHSGHQDRDGEEEGQEVQESDHVVAEPNHDERMNEKIIMEQVFWERMIVIWDCIHMRVYKYIVHMRVVFVVSCNCWQYFEILLHTPR